MKVEAVSRYQRNEMALIGAFVVSGRRIDETISHRGQLYERANTGGPSDYDAFRPARLRERVGTIIGGVVVTVVIKLFETAVIPPFGS